MTTRTKFALTLLLFFILLLCCIPARAGSYYPSYGYGYYNTPYYNYSSYYGYPASYYPPVYASEYSYSYEMLWNGRVYPAGWYKWTAYGWLRWGYGYEAGVPYAYPTAPAAAGCDMELVEIEKKLLKLKLLKEELDRLDAKYKK